MSSREALGVDIGGVIISKAGGEPDTSFSSTNYLETAEVPGALEVIKQLVDHRFGERVFLVSKCGPRVQAKTLRWLKHHHFFERTGVKPKHVRFCLERSEKEAICLKLGITHFIDDRVDVLQSLKRVPHRFLFDLNSRTSDLERRAGSPNTTRIASRWSEIGEVLLPHSGRLRSSTVQYKQPRSIQVVIFADTPRERRYLLLRRVASHGGFWQSVTGSLEGDETHRQAAVREVLEETGIGSRVEELIELGVVNTFEIAPQWREKYAPGVTHNEEVCFALQVCEGEVRVDPIEHDASAWETYERAMEMIYWDSNKRALAAARLRFA